jgi:hypothetical protein
LRLVSRFTALCIVSSLSVAATACSPSTTVPVKTSEAAAAKNGLKPEYDDTGRLTRLTFDRDGDGKIDTWGYMDGSRVVRVEVDEDGDGKVDRWEYHRDPKNSATSSSSAPASGQAPGTSRTADPSASGGGDPTLERIDRATKHDGKISRREYFENGVLTRVEEDTDGDGKIDKWETYSNGTLVSMAIDTKGRGTPDRRLIYLPDGALNRIETDPSGTGTWQPLPAKQ